MSLQVGLGVVLDGRINEPMIQKARALAKHRNNTSPLACIHSGIMTFIKLVLKL